MKKANLCDFGDLLMHATDLGYDWNQAHEFLMKDKVIPMYEEHTITHYMSDMKSNAYGWCDDSLKVVKSFMEKNNVDEFTITE